MFSHVRMMYLEAERVCIEFYEEIMYWKLLGP